MVRIAAVDIGSNSVLMSVGEPLSRDDYRVIYESCRTTRLGEGLDRTFRLSRKGIDRTLRALAECRQKARVLGVAIAKAAATAAVREAKNGPALVESAEEALGFAVEVVTGKREAELTFKGVAGPARAEPLLILDVGGASTELILARDGRVERCWSFPLGAARLKEAVPSEDVLRFFVRVIEVLPDDLTPALTAGRRAILVGGTATTYAAIRLGLLSYDPEKVEGHPFTRLEFAALVGEIQAVPVAERGDIPGLPASRAEIVTSGGLLLGQLLEELGVEEFSVSSRGLRHGILAELMQGKL